MTLLIVNDEELTADTMRDTIDWKQYGIDDVFVAYQAEEARKILLAEQIDILLCDIEMPGENGLSLLKWVRTTEMPVECLFLTCHASFDYAKQAIGLNCKEYILLPAKYEDIGRTDHAQPGETQITGIWRICITAADRAAARARPGASDAGSPREAGYSEEFGRGNALGCFSSGTPLYPPGLYESRLQTGNGNLCKPVYHE